MKGTRRWRTFWFLVAAGGALAVAAGVVGGEAAFAEFEAGAKDGDGLPNELVLPKTVPATGVDVIVGRAGVLVGDSLHDVPEHGSPEVLAARLDDSRLRLVLVDLSLLHHPARAGDAPNHTRLRFPVADGSLAAARPVVAHFARETPQRPSFMHGPGDGSDPEDESRCWKCGLVTHKLVSACPRCGATMQSRRWARRMGGVLAFLGAILAVGMGFVTWLLWPVLARAGSAYQGPTRFNGTPEQAKLVLLLFSAVVLFGVATFAYGVFQLASGRRSLRFVQVMFGLVGVTLLLGWLIAG